MLKESKITRDRDGLYNLTVTHEDGTFEDCGLFRSIESVNRELKRLEAEESDG